jgi:hypothetical protein
MPLLPAYRLRVRAGKDMRRGYLFPDFKLGLFKALADVEKQMMPFNYGGARALVRAGYAGFTANR